jgi:hypothetical protein
MENPYGKSLYVKHMIVMNDSVPSYSRPITLLFDKAVDQMDEEVQLCHGAGRLPYTIRI